MTKTENDDWSSGDHEILNFFYVPGRWWSIKSWKLALSYRSKMHTEMLKLIADYKEVKKRREDEKRRLPQGYR